MDIQRVRRYAGEHPQRVVLVWISKRRTFHEAGGAVPLCADPRVSGYIMAAQAEDPRIESILNELIDAAGE